MSPTARTLAECRKRGWTAQVVERRIPGRFISVDLFGVIDIVAIADGCILGIQATTGAHHANRVAKINAEPRVALWLGAGARLEVWSWSKGGAQGKRKLWHLRAESVVM
jgi:hypothetical protein